MPEMRQCAADSYGEDRAGGGAAVLGMLGVSQMQNNTKSLRGIVVVRTQPLIKTNKPPFLSKLLSQALEKLL